MDSDRRNRVAALATTSNSSLAPLVQELLAELDAAEAQVLELRQTISTCEAHAAKAKEMMSAAMVDANRLAAWIIKHPHPGPEMTEVLDLHDRTLPF